MTKTPFQGIYAMLYAFFRSDETLDHDAMAAQVDHCLERGCHGIGILGLATEVAKLSHAERLDLIVSVGRRIGGRVRYAVTIAGNSVAEQTALARTARDAGADWLILQPPMVGSYDAGVYLEFFARVADSVDLPVALQNAPQYLGRSLSGTDIARLRERCGNVVAVKSEDSALGVRRIIELAGEGMHVLGGRGGLEMIDCLRGGCGGFVLAPDTVPVAMRILELWRAGNIQEAEHLYALSLPSITFVMQSLEHFITYGKRIFAANAGLTVHDRAPCLAPSDLGLEMAERWAKHIHKLVQ